MPWKSIPFADPKIKGKNINIEDLKTKFDVIGIPCLVILDNKGNLITKDGRKDVSVEGEMAYDNWLEQIN